MFMTTPWSCGENPARQQICSLTLSGDRGDLRPSFIWEMVVQTVQYQISSPGTRMAFAKGSHGRSIVYVKIWDFG